MKNTLTALILLFSISIIHASSRSESGLILLEAPGARPASLGEAFTSMTNDITASDYNPASLSTLKSGNASFLYQKGLADDAYGHLSVGVPTKKGGMGVSVGYYDAGQVLLSDGITEKEVTAQRDLSVSAGMARQFGRANVGLNLKYLSSQLAETQSAAAYAADLGVLMQMTSRINVGIALNNFGSSLKYGESGDSLPRMARGGMSYGIPTAFGSILLLGDMSYRMNRQEMIPAAGVEFQMGILSMRAGYKGEENGENLSIGTGFMMGQSNVDYSFKMMDQNNALHQLSFAMRFQGPKRAEPTVKTIEPSLPVEFDHNAAESWYETYEKNISKPE